MVNSALRILY